MTQMSKQLIGRPRRRTGARRQSLSCLVEPRFFKALADRNRIALLGRLANCPAGCTVSQVAECCSVDISVVSRHLAVLRDAGILQAEKRGKEVFYSVCFPKLIGSLRDIADAVESCCPTPTRKKGRKR